MLIFILASLCVLSFLDARLLRRQDEVNYKTFLHYNPLAWAVWHLLLGVAVLPVYLLRRDRFKKYVSGQPAAAEAVDLQPIFDRRMQLASDAFEVLLHWIAGIFVWVIAVEIFFLFNPYFEKGIEELIISAAFSSVWMIFLIYRTTERYPDEKFYDFTALKPKGASLWTMIVLPIAAGIIFALVSSFVIMERSTQPVTPLGKIIDETTSASWLIIFIGMAIIVAPLFEEITFRGYFYRVLSEVKGKVFAIGLISFLFAFLHVGQYWGDWQAIAMVAALGLVLTVLRACTGTTIASTITHYVYNAGVTFIPIIMLVFANPAYVEYRMKFHELDFAAKESLLQKSVEIDPSLAEAYNDLAWLYAENDKNLDEAAVLIDKALGFDPENIAFLDTKAEVLFRSGEIDEAIAIEESIVTDDEFLLEHIEKQLKKFNEAKGKKSLSVDL